MQCLGVGRLMGKEKERFGEGLEAAIGILGKTLSFKTICEVQMSEMVLNQH